MTKSFAKISRRIFTQNWILDPEIDSTPRAHQNAHSIDQKRPKRHRQKMFFEMPKSCVKISRRIFTQNWILDPAIDSARRGGPNAHLIGQKRRKKYQQN